MSPASRVVRIVVVVAFATMLHACSTESPVRPAVLGNLPLGNRVTPFQPGPVVPVREVANRLEEGDDVISEGQRLFNHFNCSGCHAAGGGAIGPALTDGDWIYGKSAGNIFWTIIEGRPQGMPAFGGRISEDQVWKIVAFVRSLSKLNEEERAPLPQAPEGALRGKEVFLQGPCALCHRIRGTSALATVGPDLTHVGSRTTIASSLPNTRGNLAGWILNPQNIVPETEMPPTHLEPEDLHALLDYLETLK